MITIAAIKERADAEARVAITPETAKKYKDMGANVVMERGAGEASSAPDSAYEAVGVTMESDVKSVLSKADVLLKLQPSGNALDELSLMKKGALYIGSVAQHQYPNFLSQAEKAGVSVAAMERIPRITRAQNMDILSSQSNLAGYKAVLDAVAVYGKAMPMMMTAAGTVPPAKVVVMGAGVAGLQAIATAKRLGAIVSAFDVRAAAKEQVESLGAKFIEVDPEAAKAAETAGGYAKEMSAEYQQKQQQVIHEALQKHDIVICTALIPGKPAPILVTEETVKAMQPGSVIVDLAVTAGGNCPLSERGKVVVKYGVTLVGHENVPARLAADASRLYAKNLLNFVTLIWDKEQKTVKLPLEDEIIKATLLVHEGKVAA